MALEFVCPRSLKTIRTGWERDEFSDLTDGDELSVDCPFCGASHAFRVSEAKPPAMAED
jgi:hypothetical protein